MASMALYRMGYSIDKGKYKKQLKDALDFLVSEVEQNKNNEFITQVRGTQIQTKLGQNIDAALTLQFLNQVRTDTIRRKPQKKSGKRHPDLCGQSGTILRSQRKSEWCGLGRRTTIVVCQCRIGAGFQNKNIKVSKDKIAAARNYQKSNYDADAKTAKTEDGAGIMLYAVSSSVRGSAGGKPKKPKNCSKKPKRMAKSANVRK